MMEFQHIKCKIRFFLPQDKSRYSPMCMCAELLQSCVTLSDPMDCGTPGSSAHGMLQAKNWSVCILGGGKCTPPGDLPDPGIKSVSLMSPALGGGFFTTSDTWEAAVYL